MAVSYLKETVKGMVDTKNRALAIAGKKSIDWLPSRDMIIRSLDRQLDGGKIELQEVMMKIRSEFHKEVVDRKIDEFSFFKPIEKEVKYRLSK